MNSSQADVESHPGPAKIDVTELINTSRVSFFQLTIFVLSFLAMLIDSCDTQLLPFVAPSLFAEVHIRPTALGSAVSAGLFGALVSGLLGGMLADRIGRRPVILGGLAVFALGTLAKGLTASLPMLTALQVVTGLGLGAVYMNVLALTAEYAPLRNRQFAVTCVSMANAFGGMVAGYVTALLIGDAGWRGVFFTAGAATAAIFAACLVGLPESIRQLIIKGAAGKRVGRIVRRIAPEAPQHGPWAVAEERDAKFPLLDVVGGGRLALTLLLGVASIANFLAAYFVISWTPMLLHLSGMPVRLAVIASATIPLGAFVGSLLWGRLADLMWTPAALAIAALSSVVSYCVIGHFVHAYWPLIGALFVAGMGQGVLNAYNGLISSVYPSAMRGTALGLIVGMGRGGSIFGSLFGGVLLAAHWNIVDLYYVPAAVSVVTIICMILVSALPHPRRLIEQSRVP